MEYVIDSVLPNDFWNFVSTFALNLKYCMFQNVTFPSLELFFNNIFHIGFTSA